MISWISRITVSVSSTFWLFRLMFFSVGKSLAMASDMAHCWPSAKAQMNRSQPVSIPVPASLSFSTLFLRARKSSGMGSKSAEAIASRVARSSRMVLRPPLFPSAV